MRLRRIRKLKAIQDIETDNEVVSLPNSEIKLDKPDNIPYNICCGEPMKLNVTKKFKAQSGCRCSKRGSVVLLKTLECRVCGKQKPFIGSNY